MVRCANFSVYAPTKMLESAFHGAEHGMKFVFYQSHEDTGFVGEAKIKRVIMSENPMQFFETYGDRIFLTKEVLKEYIKSQERWGHGKKKRKLWMAIELEDIKKYDKPVKPKRFVPVGRQYIKA